MKNYEHNNHTDTDDCLFCVEHFDEAALGILESFDQDRFEHHMTRCSICRSELARLDAAVQLLPIGVAQESPGENIKASLNARFAAAKAESAASIPSPRKAASRKAGLNKPSRFSMGQPIWTIGSVFAGLCVALAVISLWNLLLQDNQNPDNDTSNFQVYAMESSNQDSGGHIGADMETKDGTMMAWNLDPNSKHEIWCVDGENNKWKVDDLVVTDSGSVMQTVSFPDEIGTYKQIYVARNDGTEELTITPNRTVNGDEPVPSASTPGAD